MKLQTRYARSGDVSIAYQVSGEGPIDLVFVPGFVSHLECMMEDPGIARFFQRLASFTRLIRFDKRGTGLSDRAVAVPSLEQRMDDVRAVMDAVDSRRAALFGLSEGGPMSLLFAATYPERTAALILCGSFARSGRRDGPADGPNVRLFNLDDWGTGVLVSAFAPSLAGDPGALEWCASFERQSASPGAVVALQRMNRDIDTYPILGAIRVPTLVLHRAGDRVVPVARGRSIAAHVPGAKFVELPGEDHVPWVGDADAVVDHVEEFLTGARHSVEHDRVLATVLFTDVVGATERAATLGDRQWRDVLGRHHALVRRELAAFRGKEIDTAGDGVLASLDGPAPAIRAARAIADKVKGIGLDIRAGVHTGECEIMGDKLAGIALHIRARVGGMGGAGGGLVSQTVKDLVAGSGLSFHDRGTHALKGVPGEWHLYAVDRAAIAA